MNYAVYKPNLTGACLVSLEQLSVGLWSDSFGEEFGGVSGISCNSSFCKLSTVESNGLLILSCKSFAMLCSAVVGLGMFPGTVFNSPILFSLPIGLNGEWELLSLFRWNV